MISDASFDRAVLDSYQALALRPLPEILLENGILRQLAQQAVINHLREAVSFSPEEQHTLIERLWEGVSLPKPQQLSPHWLSELPPEWQPPLQKRWDQIRIQKWLDDTYTDEVESYFLERRVELEQVVYAMIRLRHQGTAEELYLRLLDDGADFAELALKYSLGDERYTDGLVGPMAVGKPHARIRAALSKLTVGELHPPILVENWILLLRLVHRLPATLNDATRASLQQELLQRDLEIIVDAGLKRIYPEMVGS
jgi:parvulin-like peptidyl-prolyl isomerase